MKKRFNAPLSPCVTVTAAECRDNADKMVRKFIKKVKREGIIEEFRSRAHFIKPTTRRAEKKRDKKRLIEKVIKREKELINPRGSFRKARRN